MQLPVTGHPLHTRSLSVVLSQATGGRGADGQASDGQKGGGQARGGRLHARADVIDLRKCSFTPMFGADLQTAGIVHKMEIRAEIDPSTRVLESLEVHQPVVAVEPSERSSHESCRDPASGLQALVGSPIDAGFGKRLSELHGGPRGCSHLLTLFQMLATCVPRALELERSQLAGQPLQREPGETVYRRSALVDGYETPDGALQLAVQHHDILQVPRARVREPLDALATHWEVRALATLDMRELRFSDAVAWQRERPRERLDAAWVDRRDAVAFLVDEPIMPGLGSKVRAALGTDPANELLIPTLLQLAPGFVQCTAVFADRAYARGERIGSGQAPSLLQLGGGPDSCYMFRSDGPLLQIRMQGAK